MAKTLSTRAGLRHAIWAKFGLGLGFGLLGCSSPDNLGGAPTQSVGGAGQATGTAGMTAASAGAGVTSPGGAPAGGASTTGPAGGTGSSASGAGNLAGTGGGNPASGDAGAGGSAGAGSTGAGSAGASSNGGASGAPNLPSVKVYLAGDSTVSQYVLNPNDPKSWAGWGQMLSAYYDARTTVIDAAVGGRTARRFIQEGSLDAILKLLKAGDYLLVQFGTNDSNQTATYQLAGVTYPYYAAAETDFKTYLQQYITGAVGKQATPVLVTPPPRNSAYCNGGRSLANYGQAMIELGKADSVAVVDLGAKTHAYLSAICPKPTTTAAEMFFKINPDSTIDGTHFQENGARIMAGFVADGIGEDQLGLAAYRKP